MVQATSGSRVDFRRLVDAMSSTKLPNYAFRNRGDLTFSNESAAWAWTRRASRAAPPTGTWMATARSIWW